MQQEDFEHWINFDLKASDVARLDAFLVFQAARSERKFKTPLTAASFLGWLRYELLLRLVQEEELLNMYEIDEGCDAAHGARLLREGK